MNFSIIIPAYNSKKYINIPLDSLERQNKKIDFEVLIINDGSTDNLKETVKPYLERNKSWKIYNKENGNWGSVINYVKKNKLAKGQYITILDSDDYFESNMLNSIKKIKSEIIASDVGVLKNNKIKKMRVFFGKSRNIKIDRTFTPVSTPHGKFYKNNLFYNMVDLEEGVPYQDTVLYNDLASKAKSFYYINKPLAVWWIDREGNSTTQDWNLKRANIWLETCRRIINLPSAHNETNSWVLMYLWELNRNYKGKTPFKINVNIKKAKFKWVPLLLRKIAKMYFRAKTSKYRK